MEQCLRTLKSSLDERMGVKINVLHPVLTWLCEFVGYMMNRMEVASDGKTPYERVKGKRSEVMGLEFCEKVLWKYHPGRRMAKFDARWGYGLFLGVRSRSGELIVVDGESKEVKYVRTVKRIPEEQRWDPNNLEWITMVPWNRGSGDKEADGELPEFDVKKGPGRQLTEEEKQDITRDETPRIIHRAHLRKADFDKHGYTDRCPGCSAILRGLHVQPHSAECRNRMETALSSDIRVKNAKARMQERSAKMKRSPDEVPDTAKRRKLEDIEDQVMKEEDPTKIAELFDRYRAEYLNDPTTPMESRRSEGLISQGCSGNKRRDRISQLRMKRWEWKRSPKAPLTRGSSWKKSGVTTTTRQSAGRPGKAEKKKSLLGMT